MPAGLVNHAQGTLSNITSGNITIPSTTAGNTLVVCVSYYNASGTATDTSMTLGGAAGNFTKRVNNQTFAPYNSVWEDFSCTGGQTVVGISWTGGTGVYAAVDVYEVSGLISTGAFDQQAHTGANSAAFNSGATPLTTFANEFIVGIADVQATTITPPASGAGGWINQASQLFYVTNTYASVSSYQIAMQAGRFTYNGTNTSAGWAATTATFKAASLTVWGGSFSRNPVATGNEPPPITPLAIPVTNVAGNWLFALVSWRQDAGALDVLQYPSTVNVSDDAGNFWIPITSGQPQTGIVRAAVWMAPAARAAQFVFISPTSYQAAMTAEIFSFAAACPWYSITAEATSFTNLGTSVSVSSTPAAGQFTIGMLAWDNLIAAVTPTATGFTALSSVISQNGLNRSGDLQQSPYYGTTTGSTMSLSASASAPPAMTVTATMTAGSGGATATGLTLAVRVVTGAKNAAAQAAQAAANAVQSATFSPATPQGTITPAATGSFLYLSMIEGGTHTTYTPLAGSTFIYNTGDAVNNIMPGIVRGTSLSTAGTPVTLGASATAGSNLFLTIAEILSSGVITEDGSTPAVINTTGATTVTSASFTPPAGSLLVAIVASNGATGPEYANITDSGGRTWYMIAANALAIFSSQFRPFQLASIWVADASPTDFAAALVTVSGVDDVRAFPYGTPALENWPVLVTEIASSGVLNADPVFARGTANWSGANGATVSAVSWPLWQPEPVTYQPQLFGSVKVVPSGTQLSPLVQSETEAVSPIQRYSATAYVYSPSGFGAAGESGIQAGIIWYTSGLVSISSSVGPNVIVQPGEWTLLSLPATAPPSNAAFARVIVSEVTTSSPAPASAVFYVGYASLNLAGGYQFLPQDQISWNDISGRVFTHGQVSVTRGIQYEQQTLEAGTMTIYVANNDGVVTFGNVTSPYWPSAGDTDVPVRMRAIWPGSPTPYTPVFTGFTDESDFGVDTGTYYGFADIRASDVWSRLTQQMLSVVEQEALYDGPIAFIPCNQTGANIVAGNPFSNAPAITTLLVFFQSDATGITLPASTFTGSAISLPGAPGLSCWETSGTKAANSTGNYAWILLWQPPLGELLVSSGITIEFWFNMVSVSASQPALNCFVCQAFPSSDFNTSIWQLYVKNGGAASATFLVLNIGGFEYQVGNIAYLNGTATASYYCVVSFNRSQVTVTINPGSTPAQTVTVQGVQFAAKCRGFAFGNENDLAIADIAIYNYLVAPARSVAHYQAGLAAFASELDNWRLARIAGYSGFTPVLGMRGLDLPPAGSADVDIMTGATDTNTQVASAYFTNIAASTLAGLFVNGAGTLIYRRRAEWYNRAIGQYVLGENDSQFLSLGLNPLNASASLANWTTANNATLVSSSAAAGGPLFFPFSGLITGDGVTATPSIIGVSPAAPIPGQYYAASAWLYSPQGWTTGTDLLMQWRVGATTVGTVDVRVQIAAGSVAYITAGPAQAPANVTGLRIVIQPQGTPASSVQFFVAAVQVFQVLPDYAAGAGVAIPEAAYMADFQQDADRAQLYNYAVLTQYGTNLVSSFSGTSVLFTPSSGVIVIISNQASIAQRGQVPYTATIYLNNTIQAQPYLLNEGSIEDIANWITQTLGTPLFRIGRVTLTPVATQASLSTGLLAEVGDTFTYRRRPLGSPQTQMLTYYSKLTETIDVSHGQWTVELQLSPFPQGSVLTCDDVVHGVLTGQNLLGW